MGFLTGKKALIVGIASNRSIAYGIAQAMHREGAELAFSYPNEKLKPRVEKFAAEFGSDIVIPCDVTIDSDITGLFDALAKHWDALDALVHSVAFAPREALDGDYLNNLDREGFRVAHDISSYSLAALARAGRSMMQNTNGAIITMSYLGSERALPNYNVMGVAKASLEANVRYLVDPLQFVHYHRANLARRNFAALDRHQLALDVVDGILDLLGSNRSLLECTHHPATQAYLVEGITTAVVFDHHGHVQQW